MAVNTALTAEALVASVKRRCFWPTSNAPLTDAEILSIADEEIAGTLYPTVIASHSDYYQTIFDQSITNAVSQYRLPLKSYGPLKDVSIVDENNNEFSVTLIDVEELGQGVWSQRYYGQFLGGGLSYSMYFAGDFLNLRPIPNATQHTLRIRYYRLPNKLVLLATCGRITARDSLVVLGVPIDQLTLDTAIAFNSNQLDVVGGGNAHGLTSFDYGFNIGTTGFATLNTTTYPLGWHDAIVGDYVALSGYTPIVQLPDFMQVACIRQVAACCLEASNDQKAQGERAEAERLIDLAMRTSMPRVEGEPQIITTNNSPFRSARMSRYGGRW